MSEELKPCPFCGKKPIVEHWSSGRTMEKLIEDVIIIILLVFLPDYLMERLGLYKSIQTIIYRRVNDGKTD